MLAQVSQNVPFRNHSVSPEDGISRVWFCLPDDTCFANLFERKVVGPVAQSHQVHVTECPLANQRQLLHLFQRLTKLGNIRVHVGGEQRSKRSHPIPDQLGHIL
eukprot:Lithocolla_globosa_v1_NODE_4450_length_1432_cov_3.718228.p2 type:complete len:104 gc:universal NODE_4450_length_1432_cov_3.718228:798-1109(+)